MTWFKIDDNFDTHPKVLEAGNEAAGMWVRCGAYSSRQLTGGRVPRAIALMYGDTHLVDILVKVGLFEPIEGGWLIHDFHDYNPTKEKVVTEREAAAQRQREARERAKASREAAARKAEQGRSEADGHTVTHTVTHAASHAEMAPQSGNGFDGPPGGIKDSADVAAVQNIDDAPSRRDSRVSNSVSHTFPDPTRPVLPTEVGEEQKPAASDALFDVPAPAVPDSKSAGKPRGSSNKSSEPKPDKPNPHAVADALTRAFYDKHKQRLTQPYVALMKIIRVPISNGADRNDLARALDILATEGTAISGGTIRTATTRVEQARGTRPTLPSQRPSVDQRVMGTLAAAESLAREMGEIPPESGDPPLATVTYLPVGEFAS